MNKNIKRLLFGVAIASVIGFAQVATAAPTSTIVTNLQIAGLAGNGTECLHILNSGLVQTTSGDCLTSTTGNWAGTWQGNNSTIFYKASNPSGYITSAPATTTVNDTQAASFFLIGGQGITSTVSGATTTFTLNLGSGCSGTQFVATISPTGTITCAIPSGGGGSSTVLYGVAPIVVTGLSAGAQTSSCPTCIATNTGNWAGTWQGVNSTTFYLASNPSGFISTSTGLTTANFASPDISQWTNNSGYITGNQSITWTGTGDVTGSSSGATTISVALTTKKIQGVAVTSTAPSDHQLFVYVKANSDWEPASFTASAPLAITTSTASSTSFDITCSTCSTSSGANPSASVGTAAVNGSSANFMRADAAPAINQAATFSFSALGNTTSTANVAASTMTASSSLTIGSTTPTGLLSVVNASGTVAFAVSTSTSATSTLMIGATSTVATSYQPGCLVFAWSDVATGTGVTYMDFSSTGTVQFSTSTCL